MNDVLSIIKRLEKHPYLITRLNAMLEVAENTTGTYDLADDAEEKLYTEVQKLGNELLQSWAENQIVSKSEELTKNTNVTRHSKKNCIGIQSLE